MNVNYEFLKTMAKVSNLPIEEVARRIGHAEFENNPLRLQKSRAVPMHVLEKGVMDRIRNMFGGSRGNETPSAPAPEPVSAPEPVPVSEPVSAREPVRDSDMPRETSNVRVDSGAGGPLMRRYLNTRSNRGLDKPMDERGRFTSATYNNGNGFLNDFNDASLAAFGNAVNSYIDSNGKPNDYYTPERRFSDSRNWNTDYGLSKWIQGQHADAHKNYRHTSDPNEDISHPDPWEMAKLLHQHGLQLSDPYLYTSKLIGQDYAPHSRLTQGLFDLLSRNSPGQLRPDNLEAFKDIVQRRPGSSSATTVEPVAPAEPARPPRRNTQWSP